ncbi:MAG: VOC family protein [Gemmatimonadota bacterium]
MTDTFTDHMSDDTDIRFHADSLSASLTVRDVHASLAWYRDVLGFDVDREMTRDGVLRGVAMRGGNVRLLLNQDDGAKGLDRAKGAGFSLMFTTSTSVDLIAARIKAHGGTLTSEPADMPWGVRAFRVHDPDGYAFAVSEPLGTPSKSM